MIDVLRIAAAALLVIGATLSLLASVGLVRFPDLYTRLHAASKAGVLGTGLVLLALAAISFDLAIVLRALVAILFLVITTPVSAHLLARTAYTAAIRPTNFTKTDELVSRRSTSPQ